MIDKEKKIRSKIEDDIFSIGDNVLLITEFLDNNYYIFDIIDGSKDNLFARINKIKKIIEKKDNKNKNILLKEIFYDKLITKSNIKNLLSSTPSFKNDGIVFTSIDTFYNNSEIFKWKPIEKLSADFRIRLMNDNRIFLYANTSNTIQLNNIIHNYQTMISPENQSTFNSKLINFVKWYEHPSNILFIDTAKKLSSCHYELIINKDAGENEEEGGGEEDQIPKILPYKFAKFKSTRKILKETYQEPIQLFTDDIYECIWMDDMWIPIRHRKEKDEPNNYSTALVIFNIASDPISLESIEKLTNKKTGDVKQDGYRMKNGSQFEKAKRAFNSAVKYEVYGKYIRSAKKLLDLGVGPGTDILKWANNGVNFVLGIDVDKNSIEEAKKRYEHMAKKDKNVREMRAEFITGDITSSTIYKEMTVVKDVGNKKFNVIVSSFAFHYFIPTVEAYDAIVKLIHGKLLDDGVFIIFDLDGKLLYEHLKKCRGYAKFDATEVEAKYDINEPFKEFGQRISVKVGSIGKPHDEYLLNFSYLDEKLKEKNIVSIANSLFTDANVPDSERKYDELGEGDKAYVATHRYVIYKKFPGVKDTGVKGSRIAIEGKGARYRAILEKKLYSKK